MAESKKAKSEKKVVSKRKKLGKYILFSVAGVILLCLISFGTYSAAFAHKNYLNSQIGSLNLGGKTQDQTKKILTDQTNQFLKEPINLKFTGADGKSKNYSVNPYDIDLQFDVDATTDQIWQNGRGKNIFSSLWQQFKSVFATKHYQLVYKINSDNLNKEIVAIAKETDNPEQDYSIKFSNGKFILNTDTKDGSRIDQSKIIQNIKTQIGEVGLSPINFSAQNYKPTVTLSNAQATLVKANKILAGGSLTLSYQTIQKKLDQKTIGGILESQPSGTDLKLFFNDAALSTFVGSIAGSVDVAPKNATLSVVNGAVVVTAPETLGQSLDQNQAKNDIENALLARVSSSNINSTINLKINPSEPQVTTASIATLGLKDLIGTGTTDFTGSPASRVANIKNGVNFINGQIVQPGAEFSTITALGPIDEAHGYVQGLVIVNNQTLPADGGGLCQVSTTLFRSVLNAGLPITARTPHSYEVSYYQRGVGPGLDATIYDPKPDFKWVNDTGHIIFIQGVITGMKLTFNLFGTSDGRVATITGPTLLSTTQPTGNPIYVNTDTLPVGTTHLIDPPVPGGKTTATYTVTRNGVVINKQTFNSTYQAMPAQYLVGTAPVPAPTSTCSDGIQNGDETGIDCGGSCPNACATAPPAPTN